jgi:tetratricopeptide (TPR) repeat protein
MTARLAILLCSLTLTPSLQARTLPYTSQEQIKSLSLRGWNSAYNFDLTGAHAAFDEASRIEPLHPRPYLGKAMIVFWRYLLNRSEKDKESFYAIAEKTIDAGEKCEEAYGEDAEVKLCLGTIYGYRAFVNGRSKNYISAAWDGKKSYDYLCDALVRDPKLYDAYLGVGLFHYFITFIPKPMQWVVGLMGITGDSELGMKEMRIASQRGVFCKTEAQYYLSQFLPWHEGEFESSEAILKSLHDQYPSNTLLGFTLAVWEMKRADMRSAKDRLNALLKMPETDLVGIKTFASYKYAECLFRLNISNRSAYQRFLTEYKDQVYTATAAYRIGYIFERSGRRDSALAYYRKATERDRWFGDDAYSARRAQRLIATPVTATDTLLCAAQNKQKSGAHEEAIRLFARVQGTPSVANDDMALATFGIGETIFDGKSYAEALAHFRHLSASPIETELWLKPWSHYYAGVCLAKGGDSEGAAGIAAVFNYDEYDFKNWLEFRSRRELTNLGQKP